jgi:DNA-binding CsgD family transcriptional regulator
VHYLVTHRSEPIVHDALVISETEKERHPYYDWHRRGSDTHFRMVGQVCPVAGVQAGVALHRTRRSGPFEPRDLDLFQLLYGHLERALTIACRLGSLGAMQQWTIDLLEASPVGIVLLDDAARVVFANRAARAVAAERDGLSLSGRGLVLLDREDQQRLHALMARARSAATVSDGERTATMRVRRRSGRRPYCLVVLPITNRSPVLSTERLALCLFITDPDAGMSLPRDQLRALFDLTDAEARLAERLATGEDLRTAAEHLHITYGTARTRLTEIFAKTRTRRQAELVRLLLTTLQQP